MAEPTYASIDDAEFEVEELKKRYLRARGWTETCKTPGSFWVWTVATERYGALMASLDLAVSMQRMLDQMKET